MISRLLSSIKRSFHRGEGGFTVLEVTITGALLSVALAGFLTTLGSTQNVSSFTEKRTRALDDLRTAAAAFSKDARGGSSATSVTASSVTLSTYIGGATTTPTTVTWSLAVPSGGSAVDLIRQVESGTAVPRGLPPLVLDATASRFEFSAATNTMKLVLVTRPSANYLPIRLETEVTLRNAAS